jgi:hypothetical protein
MAVTTEFSSSYIERITTLTPGQWRSNSVVASMPFMPGRPISISTRSGSDFLHSCTASAPFSASPTTRNSAPAFQNRLHSIANQLVVIDKNNVERHSDSSCGLRYRGPNGCARFLSLVIERSRPACAA